MNFLAGSAGRAETLLQTQLPKVRELFASKVGPTLVNVAQDDEKMKQASEAVYTLLPTVFRLAVGQEAFVKFCFAQRNKLIQPLVPEIMQPDAAPLVLPLSGRTARFYAFVNDEVKGPYTLEQLHALHDAAAITESTQVCREGGEEWQPYFQAKSV